MGKLIDADAVIESLTEYGNGRAVYIGVEEAVRRIEQLPSAQPNTTTHDSIPAETGENDGDRTSDGCITRTQAVDALRDFLVGKRCPDDGTLTCRLIENEVINKLPTIQPEREKGEWVYNSPVTMKCNRCGLVIKDWDWHRFKICPNCGADMRGDKHETD